jgi:hypothetical protein
MTTIYQHTPFEEQQTIRIIRLHSGRSGPLICDLFEARLADKPQFEALSYVWGEKDPNCHIICHGRQLPITPNCEAALLKLRFRKKKVRLLWVDAICIDQTNIEERNQQVKLMGDIYSSAETTIAWLGTLTGLEEIGLCKLVLNRLNTNYERWGIATLLLSK